MKKTLSLILLALFTSFTLYTPVQADALDDAIKARISYYRLTAFNFGQLVAMAKGKKDYNAEKAKIAANNLKIISSLNISAHYPAGSDNVSKKGKTRALPKIWEDGQGVGKIGTAWVEAVAALADVAGDGKAALVPAVGAVGKQCSACHEGYRAKDF